MDWKEIVNAFGTQKDFAEHFKIPLRSVENWCGGKRTPPEYVERLIVNELIKDGKIMRQRYIVDFYFELMEDGARVMSEDAIDSMYINDDDGELLDLDEAQAAILHRLMELANEHGRVIVAEICDNPMHRIASWAIGPGEEAWQTETNWAAIASGNEWTVPRVVHDAL